MNKGVFGEVGRLGPDPGSAQGSLLVVLGEIMGTRGRTQLGCMQGKFLTCCAILL